MGQTQNKELLYYIDISDFDKILKLIQVNHDIINQSLFSEFNIYPLQRAAWRGDQKLCEILLSLDANIDAQSDEGLTALMWSMKRNNNQIAFYLIDHNADLSIKDKNGVNTMDYAILTGNYDIAFYLKDKYKQKYQNSKYYEELQNNGYQQGNYDFEKIIYFLDNNYKTYQKSQISKKKKQNTYDDPVIDRRETWIQFFQRIAEFEDPPICERKELPLVLQPQTTFSGMFRSYINGKSPFFQQKQQIQAVEQTQFQELSKHLNNSYR